MFVEWKVMWEQLEIIDIEIVKLIKILNNYKKIKEKSNIKPDNPVD